jgi:hypothetical protein
MRSPRSQAEEAVRLDAAITDTLKVLENCRDARASELRRNEDALPGLAGGYNFSERGLGGHLCRSQGRPRRQSTRTHSI